jgi:hypothetical protein
MKITEEVQETFRLPCHLMPYYRPEVGEPTIPDWFERVKGAWFCLSELDSRTGMVCGRQVSQGRSMSESSLNYREACTSLYSYGF